MWSKSVILAKCVSLNEMISKVFNVSSTCLSFIFLLKFPIFKCTRLMSFGVLSNRHNGICGNVFSLTYASHLVHVLICILNFLCS